MQDFIPGAVNFVSIFRDNILRNESRCITPLTVLSIVGAALKFNNQALPVGPTGKKG